MRVVLRGSRLTVLVELGKFVGRDYAIAVLVHLVEPICIYLVEFCARDFAVVVEVKVLHKATGFIAMCVMHVMAFRLRRGRTIGLRKSGPREC